ncbi:hypothetical protein GCM10023315_08800 [Algibacter aquimarinus]|uniref:Uncharacterized protein n=1 Tax=Algibacter aquimarinus TaxID=1136748 RepID=A0ABP9H778_9FLAO
MPNNTMRPNITCIGFSLDFVKKGSSKAVITGNVNIESIPTATLLNFRAKK